MRATFLAGALLGLLVAILAVAALVFGLQPRTIIPATPTPLAVSTAGAGGSGSPPSSSGPVATGGSLSSGLPSTAGSRGGQVGIAVGQRAPALQLDAVGGGRIDLAAALGKPVWVNFTASWCPSCRDELGLMNRFRTQLGDRMAMLVVDVREDPDTVASLVDSTDIQAPVGLDPDGTAADAWRAYVLPVHYWIDADGIVRGVLYGAGPPDAFIRAIHTVLPSASLTP